MSTEEKEAERLFKVLKDYIGKSNQIIKIIINLTNNQRQYVKSFYKKNYNEDLIEKLKVALKEDFSYIVTLLFDLPIDSICKQILYSLDKKDYFQFLELLSSPTRWEMNIINYKFVQIYKKTIEDYARIDIEIVKKLTNLLINFENKKIYNKKNDKQCQLIANQLIEDKGKWNSEDSKFFKLIKSCLPSELLLISRYYKYYSGKDIFESIHEEFIENDDYLYVQTVIQMLIAPSEYFSIKIHDEIKNWGRDKNVLITLLINRDEVDLKSIKKIYFQKYQIEMCKDIENKCKGEFKNFLIEMVNH